MAKSRKRSRNDANTASTATDANTYASEAQVILGDNLNALPGSRKKRPPPPPADNELDLEKLIFGGSSSLLSHPSTSAKQTTGEDAFETVTDDEEDQDDQDQAVADTDLFMVDTAGGQDDGQLQDQHARQSSSSERGDSDADSDDDDILIDRATPSSSRQAVKKPKRTKRCVWTDPDDAALTIDLTRNNNLAANGSKVGVARLRRLREEVGESKISGLEYELRLRSQFEKLHPRPGWASFRLTSLSDKPDEFDNDAGEAVIINEDASKGIHDLLRSDTGLIEGYASRNDDSASKSIKARGKLKAGEIELDRLRNANDAQNAHAIAAEESLPAIEMVRFHPSPRASVLMTASKDRRVRLFQIDGKTNPLVQTIHVPDLPIQHASFHPSGSSALIAGNRPFLYAYDLQAGRVVRSIPWRGAGSLHSQSSAEDDGNELRLSDAKFQPHTAEEGNRLLAIGGRRGVVHLLDWGRSGAAGGTRIGGVRMNSPLAGFTWDAASVLGDRGTGIGVTGTGKDVELLTMSTEGSVHIWDIRNTGMEVGCTSIWNDPGSFAAKGLEVSPNGKFWTVGSDSGIVNVYKRPSESYASSHAAPSTFMPSTRVDQTHAMFGKVPGGNMDPVKTVENLVTATTTMRWNADGQILAIASKAKKDALRMVHFPSMRVFSNWPTSGTPLGSVSSVDFSPASQYVAIGNTRGKVLLYSLRHYL